METTKLLVGLGLTGTMRGVRSCADGAGSLARILTGTTERSELGTNGVLLQALYIYNVPMLWCFLVQVCYSEMAVAGLPWEHCQLHAGDTGDEMLRRSREQGTVPWEGRREGLSFQIMADCLTGESRHRSRSKAEQVGRETVPGKMKQRLAPGHRARNHHTTPTRTQDVKKAMTRVRMGVKGLLLLNRVRVCSISESGQGGTAVIRTRVEPQF